MEILAKIESVEPIHLDVTKPKQIEAALTQITSMNTGLYGLVNNAGLGGLGAFYTWSETELKQLFDVNTFGPWRMSNAFLNMLVESKGRIVNIGSQGGMITQKYFGPYTMTKHALEAYTEAMRGELEPYGVHVSIVQPGGVVSKIGPNSMPGIIKRLKRAKPPFKEEADEILASFEDPPETGEDAPESASNRKPSDPSIVSEAVFHALFSEYPQDSYLVGTQWEGDRVLNALLKKLIQANANPQHNYSRDELIALMDQHIDQYRSSKQE
jgi:short-subunit dehydrogenase